MSTFFELVDTNDDGVVDEQEFSKVLEHIEEAVHLTVGRSGCPFTIKQIQANNKNDVHTVLCGDSSVVKGMHDDHVNLCNNLPPLDGVPANFTCPKGVLDLSKCDVSFGFNPDFGK